MPKRDHSKKSKGTTNQVIEWKGASTALLVLAEIGHSRIQNRPLFNFEQRGSGLYDRLFGERRGPPGGAPIDSPSALAPALGPFLLGEAGRVKLSGY